MDTLIINADVKALIPRGYKFQKLYARDYKCYHKKITPSYTIWVWIKGKSIEVNDWYANTKAIISLFKEHINNPIFKEVGFGGDFRSLKIQSCQRTGQVQIFDYEEYSKVFISKAKNPWKDWMAKYEDWNNEIYLRKDEMIKLIKEINFLTKASI